MENSSPEEWGSHSGHLLPWQQCAPPSPHTIARTVGGTYAKITANMDWGKCKQVVSDTFGMPGRSVQIVNL